jgi:hypothetical protein
MLVAAPAAGQVMSRPTDPPLVTAAGETWFQLREPVQFAGDLYYPAGATVFFNGNTMVRTGHYNGVPLYADATVEPFSIILVPATRGLMQPYERLRRGDLAGTTGSRAPSFPVQMMPTGPSFPGAAVAPTAPPFAPGAIGVFTPERVVAGPTAPVLELGTLVAPAPVPNLPITTLPRPTSNDGVWVRYRDQRYASGGASTRLTSEFTRVGVYGASPVYARAGEEGVIYLPTSREGLVAPYRIK